jgi:hypothetical protein
MKVIRKKLHPKAAFPELMSRIGIAKENSAFNARAEKYANNAVQLAAITRRNKLAREKAKQ